MVMACGLNPVHRRIAAWLCLSRDLDQHLLTDREEATNVWKSTLLVG